MRGTISILGLYNEDNTIFESMQLPESDHLDKDTLIHNILMDCAELEALYTDPDFMKFAITEWSKARLHVWQALANTMDYEYNPIWNKDVHDEEYIKKFRVILEAMRQGTQIKFEMTNRFGKPMFIRCHPLRLEYSEKDDKFRVVTSGWHAISTVNISKMRSCVHYTGEKTLEGAEREAVYDTITLKVLDERNALERVMLHFAHFEKQVEKLDKNHYLLKIKYASADETEMVIRTLSFGPLVEVIGSESFKKLFIEKLKKQKNCGLK